MAHGHMNLRIIRFKFSFQKSRVLIYYQILLGLNINEPTDLAARVLTGGY